MADMKKGDIDLQGRADVRVGLGGVNMSRADTSQAGAGARTVARQMSDSADIMGSAATRIGVGGVNAAAAVNKLIIDREAAINEDRRKHEDISAASKVRQDAMNVTTKVLESELARTGIDAKDATSRVDETFSNMERSLASIRFNNPDYYASASEFIQQSRNSAILRVQSHERDQIKSAYASTLNSYVASVVDNAKKDPGQAEFYKAHLSDYIEQFVKDSPLDEQAIKAEMVKKFNEIDTTAFVAEMSSLVADNKFGEAKKALAGWEGRIDAGKWGAMAEHVKTKEQTEFNRLQAEARQRAAEAKADAREKYSLGMSELQDLLEKVALGMPVDDAKAKAAMTSAMTGAMGIGRNSELAQKNATDLIAKIGSVSQVNKDIETVSKTMGPVDGAIEMSRRAEEAKNSGDAAAYSALRDHATRANAYATKFLTNPSSVTYKDAVDAVVKMEKETGKEFSQGERLALIARFSAAKQVAMGIEKHGGVVEPFNEQTVSLLADKAKELSPESNRIIADTMLAGGVNKHSLGVARQLKISPTALTAANMAYKEDPEKGAAILGIAIAARDKDSIVELINNNLTASGKYNATSQQTGKDFLREGMRAAEKVPYIAALKKNADGFTSGTKAYEEARNQYAAEHALGLAAGDKNKYTGHYEKLHVANGAVIRSNEMDPEMFKDVVGGRTPHSRATKLEVVGLPDVASESEFKDLILSPSKDGNAMRKMAGIAKIKENVHAGGVKTYDVVYLGSSTFSGKGDAEMIEQKGMTAEALAAARFPMYKGVTDEIVANGSMVRVGDTFHMTIPSEKHAGARVTVGSFGIGKLHETAMKHYKPLIDTKMKNSKGELVTVPGIFVPGDITDEYAGE